MDSFIKWMGGKSHLSKEIIPLIPPHKTYAEPFAGAGWVYFAKPPSHVELINDIDQELINLYLVIKDYLEPFLVYLDKIPISEYLFNSWAMESVSVDHRGIPDVNTAARLYYVIMNAFNGKLGGTPSFTVGRDKEAAFVRFYSTHWNMISSRLKRTTIVSRDFREILPVIDGADTFFYLDPPYICATDNNRYYRHSFTLEDHQVLAVLLKDLEGKFLLSYQEDASIRALYEGYNIVPSSLVDGELFIMNYKPSRTPFYGSCSTGIPQAPEGEIYNEGQRRAPKGTPNCPHCGSLRVQQLSKRTTLTNGSRSTEHRAYECNECGGLFRPPSTTGIPNGTMAETISYGEEIV